VGRLRSARSDLALSSDFIVGFPGESDRDFQATLDLVEEIDFAQAYSFKYSPRPGTPAALVVGQIPELMKSDRLASLHQLLGRHKRNFNKACVGKVMRVLLEKPGRHNGQLVGRSPYLQSVFLVATKEKIGEIVPVLISGANTNSLSGLLAEAVVQ